MTYIFLGIAGFVIFHLVDIAAIKRVPLLKPATWLLGTAVILYTMMTLALTGARVELPVWLRILGWLMLVPSFAQVLWSLFFNLPFHNTYIRKGVGDELVTTGLYSIVRHPGVYGLGIFLLSMAIVSQSRLLFTAFPIWMTVDIIVVFVQDRVFFGRMYPGYPAYRKTTPFLIPNWQSLAAWTLSNVGGFVASASFSNLTSRRVPVSQLSELFSQKKYAEVWQRSCGFIDLSQDEFMRIQKRLLLEQLGLFNRCELGKHLVGGSMPETIEEFRETVPLTTYEDYAPFLLKRRMDVLPKKPLLWQYTSGKTGEYAYRWVPVTSRMVDEMEGYIFALMLLSCARRRGDVNLHKNDRLFYGMAPPPYATGSMARAFPHELFMMLPEIEKAERISLEERLKSGFELALKLGLDLNFSMSSMAVAIGRRFSEQGRRRTNLKDLLKKDPAVTFRLVKAMVKAKMAHRGILPRDLWNIKGLVTYGIDGEIFREKIREMWGVYPLDFHGCTEALVVAMQTWDHRYMTFVPSLQFYEFIPEKEALLSRHDPEYQPQTLLMNELTPGNYELVITSFHGGPFLRYRLGHLIKIHSTRNEELGIDIPQMSFIARIDDQIDIAGFTRLGEKVIWQAIENTGLVYEDWVARKEAVGRPILHIYIELKDGSIHVPPETVASVIHKELKKLDQPYAELESFADIHPLRVTLLPEGAFRTFKLRQRAVGANINQLRPERINPSDEIVNFLVSTAAMVKAKTVTEVEA